VRSAWVVAAAVLALAGCGGDEGPRLARADGERLASLAERVGARVVSGDCRAARTATARLQAEALRVVRAGRVPERLQEPFLSGVNDLASRPLRCDRRVVGVADVSVRASDGLAPAPHSANAAQQARNLAAWLRAYSG
jgi:hypothetical protein